MKAFWPLLIAIVIIGISIAFFEFSNEQTQTNVSDTSSIEVKSQRIVSTLTPEIKTIESTSSVITSESFEADYTVDKLKTQSFLESQPAYAVTSSQSSLSITTWQKGGGSGTFDSSWNAFSASGTQIAFIDISDNSKKTWTLPNDRLEGTHNRQIDVDSNDHPYFATSDSDGNNRKLMKLNPSTNVFTEYNTNTSPFALTTNIIIDSSDVLYAMTSQHFWRLNLSTNLFTLWVNNICSEDFDIDSSGNVYCTGFSNQIFKLETGPAGILGEGGTGGTGPVGPTDTFITTLTTWTLSPFSNAAAVTTDSSGNIFFTESDNLRAKVGRITIADNTLTEWVIPNTGGASSEIAVDSNGNVFFGSLTRLVPSTDTFTVFSGVSCSTTIEFDSSDNIYCIGSSSFSKIT